MLLNRQVSVSQPLPTTGPAIAVSDNFYRLVCDLLGNRVATIVMIRKRAKSDEVFQTERFQDAVQVVQFNDDALLEESDGNLRRILEISVIIELKVEAIWAGFTVVLAVIEQT